MTKTYTVIAVSQNTNSFGLKSIILLAREGDGLQVLQSAYIHKALPETGDEIELDRNNLAGLNYECPRDLPPIPPDDALKIIEEAKQIKADKNTQPTTPACTP